MKRLTVYVLPGCMGCDRAMTLVDRIRCAYSEDSVRVVDASDANVFIPSDLFSVPSWYVGNEVISLGNPEWSQIERVLSMPS